MLEAYTKIVERAKSQKKTHKKFLEHLKRLKPADLDQVTNRLHDEAFSHIDCTLCANCCKTTGPLLLEKDISELSRELQMKPAAFQQQYLQIDEDGDHIFKSMPCPFIGSDNLCSVYDARPKACREYPHTQQRNIYQKLEITHKNAMICPAVAEVVEMLKEIY
jgi:Fe-S-cluster containining protein